MKLQKKMIEGLDLGKMPDAPDGSRVALTNAAQTIEGAKTFTGGLQVAQDVAKEAKSLICKADMDAELARTPVDIIDKITLTGAMIAAKEITLSMKVLDTATDGVKFKLNGSDWFLSTIRFDVSGKILSWAAYPYTVAKLYANDVLMVHYVGDPS